MPGLQELERLGPYRLIRKLGAGAMGTVYLVEDTEDGREIALKVLHPHLLDREGFFQRFEREALAGERVNHPNVVRTLDCGVQIVGDTTYCVLAMEYVPGRTLRALLQQWGTVPEALVREIALQVAAGLEAIHAAGIVHRDLKPENVLITEDHQIRIMDLGVARLTQASTALTKEGQFAGSLAYAAPEQFRESAVGPAADLYALGVLIYELASGSNPFRYEEPARVLKAHLEEVPAPLARRTEDASLFLSILTATLLEKTPESRFPSARELREVLKTAETSAWWAEQERALRAERLRRPRVPVRRETKLYGRDSELRDLSDAAERALEGAGGTVLLRGEAGIGKTRLVDAFLDGIPATNRQVLYGSYPPAGGQGGIADSILQRLGKENLETALRPYLEGTPTLVPAYTALLKGELLPADTEMLGGDVAATLCVNLMRALAAEKPLVWVVEDLHFADPEGLELLLSLTRAVEGHPVLLLLTSRPGIAPKTVDQLQESSNCHLVEVSRLGARDVVLVLRDALRNERLVEKLAPQISVKSDGVPFFVFEMIRGLKEGQFLGQLPDGSYVESKVIEQIEVPSSVRGLITVRLRDLALEERAVLDIASVIGFEFDPHLLAAARGSNIVNVLETLGQLERRQGVVRAVGTKFRFDHHQFQEVVYDSISHALRQEYHALVAAVLEDRVEDVEAPFSAGGLRYRIAYHYLRSRTPAKAAPHLGSALAYLGERGRNEESVRLARTALEKPDVLVGRRRARALLRQGEALSCMGLCSQAEASLQEAWQITRTTSSTRLQARVSLATARHYLSVHRYDDASRLARESRDLSQLCAQPLLEGKAEGALSAIAWRQNRMTDSREHCERMESIGREAGDALLVGSAAAGRGLILLHEGRWVEAKEQFLSALDAAHSAGHVPAELSASANLGATHVHLRQIDEARTWMERHMHLARTTACRAEQGRARGNLGILEFGLGDFEQAQHHFEEELRISREVQDLTGEVFALNGLWDLSMIAGRFLEARALAEAALIRARTSGNVSGEARALGNLAISEETQGKIDATLQLWRQVLAIHRDGGEVHLLPMALLALGSAEARLGLLTDAGKHLNEAMERAENCSMPGVKLIALVERTRVAPESVPHAVESLAAGMAHMNSFARMEAHFTLWEVTADPQQLHWAKEALEEVLDTLPEQARASAIGENVLWRGIAEAEPQPLRE